MNAAAGESKAPGGVESPTLVIGLTGPTGCGKSTVAGWLAELGATVVDADVVAREVVEQGSPALEQVAREFGQQVMKPDGSLDREALGRIAFADPAALARLERIVHPAVRPRILQAIAAARRAGAPAVVVEAIKLVESGLAELCDEVWLVTCDPAEQRERLDRRGITSADAGQRIAAQGDIVARLTPRATRTIDTSGRVESARARVRELWRPDVEPRVADAADSKG
ncbi:MAG TPA: dephospho-CoA kinase [Candidatus Eisenbacteria bacterium]|nr:dephospho-CoA kinase [Candidatus Eisenbacteria bacterium]